MTTVWMAELMSEFLPDAVINVVVGDRDTGACWCPTRTPAMVSIAGSARACREVAKAAADDLSGSTWSWAARPR